VSEQPVASGSGARPRARAGGRATRPPEPSQEQPAWNSRSWVALLVMGIVLLAVLGSGVLIDKALEQPVPSALAGCRTSTQIGPHEFSGPQPICIKAGQQYDATVNTTQGPVVIHLYPEIAPITVNNFVVLAIHGYFNGLTFWKSEDWVVQTGDPNNDGTGGPGYNLPDEPNSSPAWGAGAVGMARVPGGEVNGSQFFIQKASWPGSGPTAVYNRFGTVTSGLTNVQLLTGTDTVTSITIKVS
jgi:cyclophilin family peptidyl-prolyl cis-trans isomerase